jgi:hypothetical protein
VRLTINGADVTDGMTTDAEGGRTFGGFDGASDRAASITVVEP